MVRTLFDASVKQGGVWGDVTFNEIALDTVENKADGGPGGAARRATMGMPDEIPPMPKAWLDVLQGHFLREASAKCAFKDWVSEIQVFPVPVEATRASDCREACDFAAKGVLSRHPLYSEAAMTRRGRPPKKGQTDGPWATHGQRQRYAELAAEIPEAAVSPGVLLYCMLEAVVSCDADAPREEGDEPPPSAAAALLPMAAAMLPAAARGDAAAAERSLSGDFDMTVVTLDHNDDSGLRISRAELARRATRARARDDASAAAALGSPKRLGSKLLLALERAAHAHMQQPRVLGRAAMPASVPDGEELRGVARTELQLSLIHI